jgi:hypothetical protein
MTVRHPSARRGRPVVGLVAMATLTMAALVAVTRPVPLLPAEPVTGEGPATSSAPGPVAQSVVGLAGDAYDLEYDRVRGKLWLAIMRATGPDELVAVDVETLEQAAWTLPDADYGGFVSRVKIGADGVVWVTQPYRLVRFDPASSSLVERAFDLVVPDALPNALDPAAPLPGTWISAIAPDADTIVVARNNVPYLVRLDDSLAEVERIPVPDPYAGAQDLVVAATDRIWLLSGPTVPAAVVLLGRNGEVVSEVAGGGTRLASADGRTLALGVGGGSAQLNPDGSFSSGPALGRSDPSRAAVLGSRTLIYDAGIGAIVLFDGPTEIGRLSLDERLVEVPNPAGGTTIGRIRPAVNDVALDGKGRVWYLDGLAQTLVRLAW